MNRKRKVKLYNLRGEPEPNFNQIVCDWLEGMIEIKEHQPPKQLSSLLKSYKDALNNIVTASPSQVEGGKCDQVLMSNLTKIMFGDDITSQIRDRLKDENINPAGFRSTISQSVAKNTGENFVNIIVWAIANYLSHQDEILVDKGVPPALKSLIKLRRSFTDITGEERILEIPIECDFCIFSRSNPQNAIICSAKTRLKEIFHIGTMWKIFFDMIDDDYCLSKWNLSKVVPEASTKNMLYVFITADMIHKEGKNTQGADVERDEPRNLIAVDASFFDYVFVSKTGISHVSNTLNLLGKREALFHELGCLLDLIEQKFNREIFSPD